MLLGIVPPASTLEKVPTIDVQEEPGDQEGQGTGSGEKLQQHALELAVAGMGSLPGWLVTQGTAGEQRTQGSWIGESLPAIPQCLLEKLQRWEFADLAELYPLGANEALNPEPDPQRHIILPGLEVSRPKKKQVTDIISWTQCFLVYIAIMHQKFPDKVPKMIAYMLTILRAQQEFEDPGGVTITTIDSRQQLLATKTGQS